MKLPISVFIVAKNEEKHIEKTFKSVQFADEIVLVDSGSTDNTLKIAEQYEAKIFHHEWLGYAKQKQYAMSLCSNDWVLNLDGDEEIPTDMIPAFKKIIDENTVDSVRFWRNDFFMGKPLSKLTKKANNHRLYKKSKSHFDESRLAHESASVKGKELFLNKTFNHYGYDSITSITTKNNHYSSLKAKEKFLKKKQYSSIKLFVIFPLEFIKEYFIQRKCFTGKRGFILSVMHAYYSFIKEAKLYEFYVNSEKCNDD